MTKKQQIHLLINVFGLALVIIVIPSVIFWLTAVHALGVSCSWQALLLYTAMLVALCALFLVLLDIYVFRPIRLLACHLQVLLDEHHSPGNTTALSPVIQKSLWAVNGCLQFFYDTQQTVGMLFNVSRLLLSSLDIDEIIADVFRALGRFGDFHVSCMVHMDSDGYLKVRAQYGFSSDALRVIRYRPSEGLIGRVYASLQHTVINNTEEEGDGLTAHFREHDAVESIVFLPVYIENQTFGVMCVGSKTPAYFTVARVKVLSTIADYIAIALHNAQLHEQLQSFNRRLEAEVSSTTQELTHTNTRLIKKVRELKVLYDTLMAISTKLDIGEVMATLMEKITELVNAELFSFMLYDKHSKSLVLERIIIGQSPLKDISFRIGLNDSGIIKDVIKSGKPYFSNNVKMDFRQYLGIPDSYALQSLVCLPVRTQFETVGVFCIGNRIAGPFTQDDIRILQLINNQLGEVLENITLYHDREKRVGDLLMLQRISSTISSSPVLPVTLKNISHIIAETLHIDSCIFHLYEDTTGELVAQVGYQQDAADHGRIIRIKIDTQQSIQVHVFKTGKPFATDSAFEAGNMLNLPDNVLKSVTGSLLVLPLRVENQIIGVLSIGSDKNGFFTSEHMRLAELIADQSAIIIDNATLYQRIRDAVRELEKMNKMKNEFISVVSHELKTPITTIMGFINILLKEDAGGLNEQQRRFLAISEQSALRLADLINDLLDISRIESGRIDLHLEPAFIHNLMQKATDMFIKECTDKKIMLTLTVPDSLPLIYIDQERLLQVFKHLLQNAVKFTEQNGAITMSVSEKGDYIQVECRDTGIGIAEENHEKVFEKFFQVDTSSSRRAGGTGLGLSIIRSIIELHGGKVWVESKLGCGAVFKIIIPKARIKESIYEEKNIGR